MSQKPITLDDIRRELSRETRQRAKTFEMLVRQNRLSPHQAQYRDRVIEELFAILDEQERRGGWPIERRGSGGETR